MDVELLEAERVLRRLEATLGKSRVPQAPRFQESMAEDCSADLEPERSRGLVFRGRRSHSFCKASMGQREPWAQQPIENDDTFTPSILDSEFLEPSASSARGQRASMSTGSRWGPPPSDSSRRFRVRVRPAAGETLGLCIDTRRQTRAAVVLAVRPNSALARWNEACRAEKQVNLLVQPGDSVVEANGLCISCASDLRSALPSPAGEGSRYGGPDEVTIVFRRELATPGPVAWETPPASGALAHGVRAPPSVQAGPTTRRGSRSGANATEVPAARRFLAAANQGRGESERLWPGRCSRLAPSPLTLELQQAPLGRMEFSEEGLLPARAHVQSPGTFGGEARFWEKKEDADGESKKLLLPSDTFLSNKATPKGALIAPPDAVKPGQLRDARRWLQKVAQEKRSHVASVALSANPGLRGITSAWKALLQEESFAGDEDVECHDDEGSTDVGSELSSEFTSIWSSPSEESAPGPGAYNPSFEAIEPRGGRGAPSFERYSAREPQRKPQASCGDESQDNSTELEDGASSSQVRSEPLVAACTSQATTKCRGGHISPLPSARPRAPTSARRDAEAASERPFYDAWSPDAVEPSVPVPCLGPGLDASRQMAGHPETGRFDRPEAKPAEVPGPGDYDVPAQVPGGRAAFIAPEAQPPPREVSAAPGPADYDAEASQVLVYPRARAATFGPCVGHSMEFQSAPSYAYEQPLLDPSVKDAVLRRSFSAFIPPERSREAEAAAAILARRAPFSGTGAAVGPGAYDSDDHLIQRLRSDVSVLPWVRRTNGIAEHTNGLFNEYDRRGRHRLDERVLLGREADLALRRRHPSAVIRPLSEPPPRRSWSAGDIWRLYDAPHAPEPTGLASFSRKLDFESWGEAEARWQKLEERHERRMHPNLQLAYSLPDLETLKPRAPVADFASVQGRPVSDVGADDSPREGDVLLLDLHAERELLHPRVPAPVDMARQVGRQEPADAEIDDFEELVLTPRPVQKRTPCFVDMAKAQGRDVPELDEHVREEELELEVAAAEEYLRRRPPSIDFARPLGRPGADPRVDGGSASTPWGFGRHEEEDIILTNWEEPFRAPLLPTASVASRANESTMTEQEAHLGEDSTGRDYLPGPEDGEE
eukprot:TRINITY_DN96066_c0_g1_i1.p1 TRINITY_DN96066_c0_g1~~TRINITY_DN96066_c0_g1_i1.p1  ORF type:complete len:1125 (-),score=197.92 TRINITY_DN96066_c0_g1_i1:84-3428(-)